MPKPEPGTRRFSRPEPTELVELTHDRHAFVIAMGSLALAVLAIIGVIWWISHRRVSVAQPNTTVPLAAASSINISIRDPIAEKAITVGARVSVLVSAFSDASPLTEVSLLLDGKEVGRRSAPPYGFLLDDLSLGVHRLTAKAATLAGDSAESAPISIVIAVPRGHGPLIRANSTSRSIATVGVPWVAPISIRAGDAPLAAVQLFDGNELLAETTSAPWLLSWTPPHIGARHLTITTIDSDHLQDTYVLDLVVCGNSGLIRIGHREVTELTLDSKSSIDWLRCDANGDLARRSQAEVFISLETLGISTLISDPLMPAITWKGMTAERCAGVQSSVGGFRFTATSGPGPRRFELLLGASAGPGALSVELEDASAAPLRDETVISEKQVWQLVTIDFRGGTGPTRILVEWTPIDTSTVYWSAAILRNQ